MKTVYLAGPISGLTFDGCTDWRREASDLLFAHNIKGLSPMRAKGFLRDEFKDKPFGSDGGDYQVQNALSTNKGITTRDRNDCMRSDAVIFNFLGAPKASVGSCIELGWADAARNPVILVMEKAGNYHHHGMVIEIAGYWVETVEEAVYITATILGAG